MADSLRILAQVSHNQAESAADDLEAIADKQEKNLKLKEKYRDAEKVYDNAVADGIVTFDELVLLHEMRTYVGTTDEAFWGSETVNEFEPHELGFNPWKYDKDKIGLDEKHGNNSHFYLKLGDKESAEGRKVQEIFDNMKKEIENSVKDKEDVQAKDQFEIQMATSDLQNSESVRQQAYKKMDESRDKGSDAWGQ